MPKKLLPLALLAILLSALGYSLMQKNQAPDLTLATLDGKHMQLSALRGRMVLINFWATTCPGCVAEMPDMIETYRRHHPQGFELIAIAMAYDPADQVSAYARKNALPFPVVLDADGLLARKFGDIRLTPTAILIDKQGNIVRTIVGELDFAELNRQLEQELGRTG